MSRTNPTSNKTLYGSIAMLIALVLEWLKVDVQAAQIEIILGQAVDAVQVLLGVGGAIITIYAQWKAGKAKK